MKRTAPSRRVRRVPGVAAEAPAPLVESLTLEALDRIVALLACNGVAQNALEQAFRRACERHSRTRRPVPAEFAARQYDATLLLAAWHTDLDYLDPEGRPLRLPLNGAAPSLHGLIKRTGLTVPARDMVRYLEQIKAVRCVGQRYAPRRLAKPLLGTGSLANRERLRLVVRLLRSLEENRTERRAGNGDRTKVVTALESTEIPVRLLSVCQVQLTRDIQQFLRELQSRMLRYERARVRGEPLLHLGFGVFQFEDAHPDGVRRAGRRKKTNSERRTSATSRSV